MTTAGSSCADRISPIRSQARSGASEIGRVVFCRLTGPAGAAALCSPPGLYATSGRPSHGSPPSRVDQALADGCQLC